MTEAWVLVDESPSEGGGVSLCGVFATEELALTYLRDVLIGSESFDKIVWRRSTSNDGFIEGRDPNSSQGYALTREGIATETGNEGCARTESGILYYRHFYRADTDFETVVRPLPVIEVRDMDDD